MTALDYTSDDISIEDTADFAAYTDLDDFDTDATDWDGSVQVTDICDDYFGCADASDGTVQDTEGSSGWDSDSHNNLDTGSDDLSEAGKAADYARSLGFYKAADYIERHYDGKKFDPDMPIPITTRNMSLEGKEAENGVPFERRTAELTEGLSVEGVFPDFESRHHVELGTDANDMSLHQQFSACKEDFQNHLYDSPEKTRGMTIGAMERLEQPQGYTPEGFTWQHNPETGSFDLVSKEDHSVGHTGGNALWGD